MASTLVSFRHAIGIIAAMFVAVVMLGPNSAVAAGIGFSGYVGAPPTDTLVVFSENVLLPVPGPQNAPVELQSAAGTERNPTIIRLPQDPKRYARYRLNAPNDRVRVCSGGFCTDYNIIKIN